MTYYYKISLDKFMFHHAKFASRYMLVLMFSAIKIINLVGFLFLLHHYLSQYLSVL